MQDKPLKEMNSDMSQQLDFFFILRSLEEILSLPFRFPEEDVSEEFRESLITLDSTKETFEELIDDITAVKGSKNEKYDFSDLAKFNKLFDKIKRLEMQLKKEAPALSDRPSWSFLNSMVSCGIGLSFWRRSRGSSIRTRACRWIKRCSTWRENYLERS